MVVLRVNAETDVAEASPAAMVSAVEERAASQAALEHARSCLERALAASEDWRALKQLEAREANGEWFDVVESDVLRDRLTLKLAAAPEFIAWQFVDAAVGCLNAGAPEGAVPSEAIRYDGGSEIAPSSVVAIELKAPVQPVANVSPSEVPNSGRELALRIPTLQANDRRPPALRSTVPPVVDAAQHALERTMLGAVNAKINPAPHADALTTRFATVASSVDEADVQIVTRAPAQALVETRLPPLPLTERVPKPGMRLPRVSRAPALKWAEPVDSDDADFRPIGSALDEAQVSIIDTGAQSEADARAERRALGVAPDREQHMRRFLRALVGE